MIGLRAFYASAAGMEARNQQVNAVADDIANLNTVGFKGNTIHFGDLATQDLYPAGRVPPGAATPWVRVGNGGRLASIQRDWSQGPLQPTNQPWDMALEGEGFFAVRLPDGSMGLTRAGAFRLDGQGTLVDPFGNPVLDVNGQPIVPGNRSSQEVAATVGVVLVDDPAGLIGGKGVWLPGPNAGGVQLATAGQQGRGTIQTGMLEAANVDLATAMTSLIIAQRAFQMNAAALKNSDTMWQQANEITA